MLQSNNMEKLKHKEVFEKFREEAEDELGDSLKKLILYGSVARGDHKENSDIDVFALVENKKDLDDLRDLAFDIGVLDHGVSISVQGTVQANFEGFEKSSYLRNVSKDGVEHVRG